jgi:anthranilate phosphoribosyltransferase
MQAREALDAVVEHVDLTQEQALAVMQRILAGEVDPAWTAAFLIALRMKGEAPAEIAGFAQAMRAHATAVPCASRVVDTCGTGGDGAGTFNISTAAAFVVAGAGGHVAKHGNRSVSSQCGSADVLEALDVDLHLSPDRVGQAVDEIGFGFLFAPSLHAAMKHAAAPRRALGLRTVFNVLGPLTNPAGAVHQVMGVFSADLLRPLADVLGRLGTRRSVLVHGHDGLDEITVTGPTQLVVAEDEILELTITPEEVGLARHPAADLRGGDAATNARILREILDGAPGAARDVVVLNAGAALWAGKWAPSLADGCQLAAEAIDAKAARRTLDRYVEFSRRHRAGR